MRNKTSEWLVFFLLRLILVADHLDAAKKKQGKKRKHSEHLKISRKSVKFSIKFSDKFSPKYWK